MRNLATMPITKILMYVGIMWCLSILVSSCQPTSKYDTMSDGQRWEALIKSQSQNIDLPEEWQALSTDNTHPDTLTGYKDSSGVIHISFTGKHR